MVNRLTEETKRVSADFIIDDCSTEDIRFELFVYFCVGKQTDNLSSWK